MLQQELQYKATHDSLTKMYNRDYFEERFDFYNKQQIPMAVIVCDVNNLKCINDKYGHNVGDDLIRNTAILLKSLVDGNREFYRIGGDEFVLFIPQATADEAKKVVEEINQLEIDYNAANIIAIQMAKGYAYSPSAYGMMEKLFIKADNEMYENKKQSKEILDFSI